MGAFMGEHRWGSKDSGSLGQARARDPSHQLRLAEGIPGVSVSPQTALCGRSYGRKTSGGGVFH